MTDVVVLGGTGFLGRHIAEGFAARGRDVLVVRRDRPPAGPATPRSVALDLAREPDALADLLRTERPAVLVNAAGSVWATDEQQMYRANVTAVENVLSVVAGLPWRLRVVHLGSAHEYGPLRRGDLVTERSALAPRTPYGRTKLRATNLVLDAVRRGRVDGVVLRVSNGLGVGAPPASLLGATARRLRAARAAGTPAVLPLHTPMAYRDFVDVADLADGVVAAAARPVRTVVNLGGGTAVSVRTVMERLAEISGVPAEIAMVAPAAGMREAGEWQQLDITAAGVLLGWRPRRELDETLRAYWLAGERELSAA
jgi:dTDP-6-deoxy-L-talose 4-dehydrogenase [NAD(P)+]